MYSYDGRRIVLVEVVLRSETQLRPTPHPSLRVESDGVTSSHTHPLRDGAVLSLLLGQHTLYLERLVGRHFPSLPVQPQHAVKRRSHDITSLCACVNVLRRADYLLVFTQPYT